MLEASQHKKNCFITLTYAKENLPKNKSLVKRDFQLFMKRLRKKYGAKIRFYACGEYGDLNDRPHYHSCIFGLDFADKQLYTVRDGINLYQSEALDELWPYGFATVGEVTFESAAYVARYICKKINGKKAEAHYQGKIPEFSLMSRRPGIASSFFELYTNDIYNYDTVVLRGGCKLHPPRYFDKKYDEINPLQMRKVKAIRQSKHNDFEMQGYRLRAKARLYRSRYKQLKRGLEQNA